MNILFLNGAGGTGKSSIVSAMNSLLKEDGDFATYASSTRATYARLGYVDEKTSIDQSPQQRIDLQLAIMEDECNGIRNALEVARKAGCKFMVIDRGPLDRMAYYLLTMKECQPGDHKPFFDMLQVCIEFLDSLQVEGIYHAEFAYPVPWKTEDNFRQTNYLQTLELSLLTTAILQRFSTSTKTYSEYLDPSRYDFGTPETRASNLLRLVGMAIGSRVVAKAI